MYSVDEVEGLGNAIKSFHITSQRVLQQEIMTRLRQLPKILGRDQDHEAAGN